MERVITVPGDDESRLSDCDAPESSAGYAPARGSFVDNVGPLCDELRREGSQERFRRNEFLLVKGNSSNHVLLIESGLVKVRLNDANGSQLIVGLYGHGELIGEQGVLADELRSADVIGHSDGVVTRVPSRAFHRFLDEHPETLHLLLRIQHSRLRKADHRQLTVATHDVQTRVVKQLLAWADTIGSSTHHGVLVSGLTRKDLANCVSASEQRVDKVLSRLTESGFVRTHWRKFLLPSPEQLREHLRGPRGPLT